MNSIFESIINLIWDEWIYATYKRHGWPWAIVAAIGPIVAITAILIAAILLLRGT